MSFSTLEDVLWAAGGIGNLILLIVLLVRRRWRTFPIFTALIGYELAESITLLIVSWVGSKRSYFLAFWSLGILDVILQFALIWEMASLIFKPSGRWIRVARQEVSTWCSVALLIAVGLPLCMHPSGAGRTDLWEMRAALSTSLATCEFFLAVSVVANRFQLKRDWHIRSVGIGLTIWSAAAIAIDTVHVATGWHQPFALDKFRQLTWISVLIFWSTALWVDDITSSTEQLKDLSVMKQIAQEFRVTSDRNQ